MSQPVPNMPGHREIDETAIETARMEATAKQGEGDLFTLVSTIQKGNVPVNEATKEMLRTGIEHAQARSSD